MSDNNKIEYRKVTPEEKLYVSRLQGIVFSFDPNEKEIREKIEKGEYNSDNTYGAVDENGRVLAGMEILPFTMWFDGQKVPMYGIGGVASMPETRRQGNIRKIFEKVFEDIYEKGAVFSHLFPFSHDYYRKFGYEHCGAVKRYTLSLAPARRLKNNGTVHEFIKGDDVRDNLIEVYETYASRHNIMPSRSEIRWNEVFNISLFGAERLYYWEDAEHNIKAWVKFKKDNEKMRIRDIAWVDREGMLGILQFMGMFEGAAEKLVFSASPEFIAEIYWNNLYEIEISTDWMGMSRVVNAKRALELMRKPDGNGRFVIKIADGFAKWNNNAYAVEYGDGECTVNTTTDAADIEVSECALVQMVLGVYELKQVANRDDVQINDNKQTLIKVFHKKNLLITDSF
ncbi:MAG: GNAT family N-acetyltransferase [Oscillospiraceae bacterium]|nr:GNAT family N-acetyltransferase [Oscillospiraceae bacterium]